MWYRKKMHMRIKMFAGCFLLILVTILQFRTSGASPQIRPPHEPGPSLTDTLSSLNTLITGQKITARASNGLTFADMHSMDRGEWSISHVDTGPMPPCLVSWDEDAVLHYDGGSSGSRSEKSSERHFISLKVIWISDIEVLDLKSWANNDGVLSYDSTVPSSKDGIYSGYVLTMSHSVVTIAKRSVPNPSGLDVSNTDRLFFTSKKDADLAKSALAHAAALCGSMDKPL